MGDVIYDSSYSHAEVIVHSQEGETLNYNCLSV